MSVNKKRPALPGIKDSRTRLVNTKELTKGYYARSEDGKIVHCNFLVYHTIGHIEGSVWYVVDSPDKHTYVGTEKPGELEEPEELEEPIEMLSPFVHVCLTEAYRLDAIRGVRTALGSNTKGSIEVQISDGRWIHVSGSYAVGILNRFHLPHTLLGR